MKKIIYAIIFLAMFSLCNTLNAQTSIADGNWSNPMTWGGAPPMSSGTVIINHAVTLDVDYAHTSGSITINTSGSLNGNSSMRAFAINFPGGSATLTVNGSFNVARVSLVSNTVTISGTFQSDSLLNSSTLTLSPGATISTSQFMNNTGGTINNSGGITSTNFLNIATLTNSGNMTSNDLTNAKSFTNSATGYINITNDFSNIDTLASPAIFTNNGIMSVANDWHNGNQIDGSGKFCIGNNTWNSGVMTGTFDFCDQTGGGIDLNTGTIAGTITYCVTPCSVGLEEVPEVVLINVYPNPFSSSAVLQSNEDFNDATLAVYNIYGQRVKQIDNLFGETIIFYSENLSNGLYLLRLTQGNKTFSAGKFVITDK